MPTTKKPISPRITDASITPVLEDTPVVKTPATKPTVESEPHVKSDFMKQFFQWKKKYGSTMFYTPVIGTDKEPEYVGINGMGFKIDRGVSIDLPNNIKDILNEKYHTLSELGSNVDGADMRVDGNANKINALN